MKFSKRIGRVALTVAVTAAVCFPALSQLRSNKAKAQTPDAAAPAAGDDPAKQKPVIAFPETDPGKIVLSIGEQKITAGEFKTFFSELQPSVQQNVLANPEAKRQLAEQFIDMKLLAAEARRQKLDGDIDVRTTYEQLLANALMVSLAKDKDANIKFFTDHKDYFSELQARHILIGVAGSGIDSKLTDAQAKAKADEIKKRLDKGEDFASIARTESDDKQSAATGGSLGMIARGQMVPPFEQAAYGLKDNEISNPVKTQFGYHIIQVLSHSTPMYDQVAERVPQRRMELMIEELKKAQKPEIDDGYFGAHAAPTSPPATSAPAPASK